MADKTIQLRIDVSKLKKEWFFKGEKGTYADLTLFYNEVKDQYENNGMIVQQVPKAVYEKEKDLPKDQKTSGPILGNARVWQSGNSAAIREASPGYSGQQQQQAPPAGNSAAPVDDLPF